MEICRRFLFHKAQSHLRDRECSAKEQYLCSNAVQGRTREEKKQLIRKGLSCITLFIFKGSCHSALDIRHELGMRFCWKVREIPKRAMLKGNLGCQSVADRWWLIMTWLRVCFKKSITDGELITQVQAFGVINRSRILIQHRRLKQRKWLKESFQETNKLRALCRNSFIIFLV